MCTEFVGKCDSCGYYKQLIGECRECGRSVCYDCSVDVMTEMNNRILVCRTCLEHIKANQPKEPSLLESLMNFGMNEIKKHQRRQAYWEDLFWSEMEKKKRKNEDNK